MHLRTFLSPLAVFDRLRFLARCLHDREVVEWFLDDPEFARRVYHSGEPLKAYVHWLAGDDHLVQELYQARDQLKSYFACKWDLAKMAFQEGTIFPEEQPLLRKLVEASNSLPGPIIEIGTLFGSTTTLLALWKSPHKKIVTVDNYSWNPWQLSPVVHRNLTAQALGYLSAKGEVDMVCQDKQAFYDTYRGEPPALVFLDADHSYEATKADIQWAKRVGAAIICGHDYASHCPGVGRAVEEEGGTQYHSHTVWALKTAHWQHCPEEKRPKLAA
ncbi:MAG TPA: class I SAM-dependent methyltransferase [Pirellulales bacterium]|nr:class I SAM-dependent methyltransferase [Pirellulales bacterium]